MKQVLLFSLLALMACGQKHQDAIEFPTSLKREVNVEYRKVGEQSLFLDLFIPEDGAELRPGILFVHGGGWRKGNKTKMHRLAAYFAAKGYLSACVQYRLSPMASHPEAVHDLKAAVRWLRAHAGNYQLDPNRIAAIGGSAGGHLASFLALTPGEAFYEGDGAHLEYNSRISAAISLAGPMDFINPPPEGGQPWKDKLLSMMFDYTGSTFEDDPSKWREASPISHIDPDDTPLFLLHGDQDPLVPVWQSQFMYQAMQEKGMAGKMTIRPGGGHGVYGSRDWFLKLTDQMDQFMRRHFSGR